MSGGGDTTRVQPRALIVHHQGRDYVIPSHFGGLFAIGRGSSCQIVLDDSVVSRLHGCIRASGLDFVYRDTSSNGTILLDGHDETLIQESEVALPASGALKIGDAVLRFHRHGD